MAISLEGKVAIVTGAGRGIGKSIAKVFAANGAKVVVANRRESEGQGTVKEIEKAGGEALFVQTDVRAPRDIGGLVEQSQKRYGRIDILCHNAAIYPNVLIDDMSIEMWDDVLDTGLAKNHFNEAQNKQIIDFLKDPENWGRTMGFV